MPPGIDTLTAAPMTIEVGGRSLRISPLTLSDLGQLQAWIHAQLLDQATVVARRFAEGMPKDVQIELLDRAVDRAMKARESHQLGSLGADAVMGTTDGLREVLALGLRKHHPEMDRPSVATLLESLEPGDIDRILSHAFGDETGGASDPKGRGEASVGAAPSIGPASSDASGNFPTASTPMRSAG